MEPRTASAHATGGPAAPPPAPAAESPASGDGEPHGEARASAPLQAATGSADAGTGAGAAQATASPAPLAGPGSPAEPGVVLTAPAATAASGAAQLQQTIEAARATFELAARDGAAQVRISLQPPALGDIRIHLSQTADGLLARVTADTQGAAQVLAAGRAELHQSLSSLGVSLLRLDIGSWGQAQAGGGEGSAARDGEAQPLPTRESGDAGNQAPEGEEIVSVPLRAALSSGGLVDVLA